MFTNQKYAGAHIQNTHTNTIHNLLCWIYLSLAKTESSCTVQNCLPKMENISPCRTISNTEQHSLEQSSRYALHPIKMTHPHCHWGWAHSMLSIYEGGQRRVSLNSSTLPVKFIMWDWTVYSDECLCWGGRIHKIEQCSPHGFQKNKIKPHKTFYPSNKHNIDQ